MMAVKEVLDTFSKFTGIEVSSMKSWLLKAMHSGGGIGGHHSINNIELPDKVLGTSIDDG